MWNLKKSDTDEIIPKTETDSQTETTHLSLPKGKNWGAGAVEGRDKLGGWGLTYTYCC